MNKSLISRIESNSFSKFTTDFISENSIFTDFIQNECTIENFGKQIELKKSFENNKRKALHETLTKQYAEVESGNLVSKNIESILEENTFTVTTGHQLNIFTGPIFFIYKILHTIKLAEELKLNYPNYNFVPIYWMASEDHDFEEINHTTIFNRKIEWKSEQTGPVGNFQLDGFQEIKEELKAFFSNHPNAPILDLLEQYDGKDLAEASFKFVHAIFKEYGLVILDANLKALKNEFTEVMLKEVESSFSEKAVQHTTEKLEKLGYKSQIFARPINLFYIGSSFRERITLENRIYETEQLGKLSLEEIKLKITSNPEQFSPNVVLRPVYQEVILPNLAYVGGGAEIAYWTQLKGVFDALNLVFPLIQIRNSLQIIDTNSQKKLAKLKLNAKDLFKEIHELKTNYTQLNSQQELDFSAIDQASELLQAKISELVTSFDINLNSFAEAEKNKISKQVENLQQKLLKQQKTQFEQEFKLLEDLKNKLFPNGGLQERTENFITFCPDGNYPIFIEELLKNIMPMEKDLIVLEI